MIRKIPADKSSQEINKFMQKNLDVVCLLQAAEIRRLISNLEEHQIKYINKLTKIQVAAVIAFGQAKLRNPNPIVSIDIAFAVSVKRVNARKGIEAKTVHSKTKRKDTCDSGRDRKAE
jgi:hypothetical protein